MSSVLAVIWWQFTIFIENTRPIVDLLSSSKQSLETTSQFRECFVNTITRYKYVMLPFFITEIEQVIAWLLLIRIVSCIDVSKGWNGRPTTTKNNHVKIMWHGFVIAWVVCPIRFTTDFKINHPESDASWYTQLWHERKKFLQWEALWWYYCHMCPFHEAFDLHQTRVLICSRLSRKVFLSYDIMWMCLAEFSRTWQDTCECFHCIND